MTLIFAKENTLEALREAIEARRTLAYSFGTIAGDEQLLKDLFTGIGAHERAPHRCEGTPHGEPDEQQLGAVRSAASGPESVYPQPLLDRHDHRAQNRPLRLTVENMWYSEQDHPQIELML